MVLGAKFRQVRWNPLEYFFIYLPFISVFAVVSFMFGSIEQAIIDMEMSRAAVGFTSAIGGYIAALMLLPRIWVAEETMNRVMLTLVSSLGVSLVSVKFFFITQLF